MSDQKIRVGITHGDINGIGYEVIIKCFADSRMSELCTPILYGSSKIAAEYKKGIKGAENLSFNVINNAKEAKGKRLNVINCSGDNLQCEPGVSTPEAGRAAVDALKAAVKDLKAGNIDVIVTAPINKENVQSEDFPYTGHTEFFAAEFNGEPLMMMCSDKLKVGLVTVHLPVSQISQSISKDKIVTRLEQLKKSLISDFSIVDPRIAVMSLNPHAGDGGLLGSEEQSVIKPAITQAYEKDILAFGPFAADGLFAGVGYTKYDAILAMYHDQGLAPFKAITPYGVNFTAGLDVVRTSPDHGVAYDIAGKGVANEASMREAVYMALDIFRSRKIYKEITKNPLRHYERERGGADVSVKDLLPAQEES